MSPSKPSRALSAFSLLVALLASSAPCRALADDGEVRDADRTSWARRVFVPEREGGLTELALEAGYGQGREGEQFAMLRGRVTYRFDAPWSVGLNVEPGIIDLTTANHVAWATAPRIEGGFDHDYVGLEARLGLHISYMVDQEREVFSPDAHPLRSPMAGFGFRLGARDGVHLAGFFDAGLTRRDRGILSRDHVRRAGGHLMVPLGPLGAIGHGLLVTTDEVLVDLLRFRLRLFGDRGRGTVFLTGALHVFYNPTVQDLGHGTAGGALGAEMRL